MVRKGEQTKQNIIGHAMDLARSIGLEGLSIGRLADDLKLSKSGLFAHFQSKERLQIQVLEATGERFAEQVIRPALKAPRGAERLWAIFDHWIQWGMGPKSKGCLFVAAAAELDDQTGPVRDTLVRLMKSWVDIMVKTVEIGIEDGHFKKDVNAEEVAQSFYGTLLATHLYVRLFGDKKAVDRARDSVTALIDSIASKSSPKKTNKN